MKPSISVMTLGVENLERAVSFYRDGLGLPTEGIIGEEFEHGAVAFFDLRGGLKLAVWPRTSMVADTGIALAPGQPIPITLGHNVTSEAEVDAVMREAIDAGAALIKPAQKTFYGGYAGYFRDPDGYLWEVVFNPAMLPPAE
jgi:catechol 2,3-dioxygenase-like lactoylglutathione lyase family enzyme